MASKVPLKSDSSLLCKGEKGIKWRKMNATNICYMYLDSSDGEVKDQLQICSDIMRPNQ
jgi:hypothetical protein